MILQVKKCPNFNHGRPNAPIRFCPMCGAVVNNDIPVKKCPVEVHTKKRSERSKYCVDCGEQLIQDR